VDHGSRVVVLPLTDPIEARPLVLEGPAAAVWHALDEPRSTAGVVAHVSADFGIPAAEVELDVAAFLSELAESGLIRPADPDTIAT
jgi:Coenzyme PQQ synthesis protein D (PqqD)